MPTSGDGQTPAASTETGSWTTILHGAEGLPAGLPDPAVLARLANEFFTALPAAQNMGNIAPIAPQLPGSPATSANTVPVSVAQSISSAPDKAPLQPPVPTQTDVASLVSTLGGAINAAPSTAALAPQPHAPAESAVPSAGSPSSVPAVTVPSSSIPASGVPASSEALPAPFAFLGETRPLYAEPAAAPESSAPAKPSQEFTPTDAAFGSLLNFEGITLPGQFEEVPQPPMPTLPAGADQFGMPTFSFIEDARPIFSSPPSAPGPVPAHTAAQAPIRSESDAADIKTPQLPGAVARPAGTSHLGSPSAGSSAPVSAGAASSGFGSPDFLNQARPLASVNIVPSLEPMSFPQDNVPAANNFSSYAFDAEAIRRDFPILRERVNGRPLVWLDNAATTQKPQSVIDRLRFFYTHENSNVHRAAHELAARATDAYESAREKVRRFLNAPSFREIIFVRGATEGINLVAQSWGRRNIQKDDEIVITWLEHHANIVPWQMLCAEKGARLCVAPVDDRGQILLDEYEKLLGPKTRLVSLPQVSNALGTVTPVHAMIAAAHRHGAKVLVDGAQSVSHMRVDVQALDCDFFVFSGHKLFAPTGIGVVFGKPDVLEATPPWQGGGNMIQDVTFEKTVYQPPPGRFEAGTGNIADAVGLGAAIDYLDRVGMENISRHEHELLTYATEHVQRIPGLRIIGTAKEKAGVLSFVLDGLRTEDIGAALNREGIAVRSGHHCAQPILRRFGLESTVRASLALYNTCEDIDALVAALWKIRQGRGPGLA